MKEICRVCLEKSGHMLNIFDNVIELGIPIANMISKVTGSHVARGDPFPETICPPCLGNAKIAFQFKQRYERNQQIYSQYKERILYEEEFVIPDLQSTLSISGDESQEFNLQIKLEAVDDDFQGTEESHEDECVVKNEPTNDDVIEEDSCQFADVNNDLLKKVNHQHIASTILKSAENKIIAILKENELLKGRLDLVSKKLSEKKVKQVHKPTITMKKKEDELGPSNVMSFPITSLQELEQFERQFTPDLRGFYIGRMTDYLSRGPLRKNLEHILNEDLLYKFNLNGCSGKLSLRSYECFYDLLETATKMVHPNEPVKKVIGKALCNIKNKIVKRRSRSRQGLQTRKQTKKC
ncbi:uncharacterized protein LOC108033439 isoform X1 [Drosophila biarmipes]|uniref:uncharacterized protein LOC108033439 isoform X1 n=1 Tax=Drosophila biarmipes TaxID=125945 RepID=UPI0007E6981D|nr:uncharacterized protein LOC108033439 isoform X1 [Drosophila biarmipes]